MCRRKGFVSLSLDGEEERFFGCSCSVLSIDRHRTTRFFLFSAMASSGAREWTKDSVEIFVKYFEAAQQQERLRVQLACYNDCIKQGLFVDSED